MGRCHGLPLNDRRLTIGRFQIWVTISTPKLASQAGYEKFADGDPGVHADVRLTGRGNPMGNICRMVSKPTVFRS